jgi:hypothetical protein
MVDAIGDGDRGLAAEIGAVHRTMGGGSGRAGGTVLHCGIFGRSSRGPVPQVYRGCSGVRRGVAGASAAAARGHGAEQYPAGPGEAPAAGQRVKHVGQEHAAARRGSECGAGVGRSARAGQGPANITAEDWRVDSGSGFAAGWKSRFYAEITRLRQIVDMAGGDPPLLSYWTSC